MKSVKKADGQVGIRYTWKATAKNKMRNDEIVLSEIHGLKLLNESADPVNGIEK